MVHYASALIPQAAGTHSSGDHTILRATASARVGRRASGFVQVAFWEMSPFRAQSFTVFKSLGGIGQNVRGRFWVLSQNLYCPELIFIRLTIYPFMVANRDRR